MNKHRTYMHQEPWKTDAAIGFPDGVRMTAFLFVSLSFLQVDFSYLYWSLPLYTLAMAALMGFGAWSTIRIEKSMDAAGRKRHEDDLLEKIGLQTESGPQDEASADELQQSLRSFSPMSSGLRTAQFYLLGAAAVLLPLAWCSNHAELLQWSIPLSAVLIAAASGFKSRITGALLWAEMFIQLLIFALLVLLLRFLAS